MITAKFEQIVDFIETSFIEHRQAHGRSPEVLFTKFRLGIDENEPPPRTVWVPVGGPIEPATGGSTQYGESGAEQRFVPIYQRQTQVLCYIFGGTSFTDTERLLDDILAAVWKCLGKLANPGVTEWITEQEEVAARALGDNFLVIQPFTWPIMVEGEDRGLTILTDENHTGTLNDTDAC